MVLFFLGEISQMGLWAEQLYKMVLLFFQKNEKHLIFFKEFKLFYIFFGGFGQRLELALQNGFGTFQKTRNTSTKWFVVFLGKCKLIDWFKNDWALQNGL